jgi:hypothetical protein
VIQDKAIPADFPRMVISSEGLKWRSIDDEQLKKATCLACGSKTYYRGMVKEGLLYYPQIVCPKCRRISDGCLTFEGYHMLYHDCPYARLGSLGTTDCRIWPNLKPATVRGNARFAVEPNNFSLRSYNPTVFWPILTDDVFGSQCTC